MPFACEPKTLNQQKLEVPVVGEDVFGHLAYDCKRLTADAHAYLKGAFVSRSLVFLRYVFKPLQIRAEISIAFFIREENSLG